MQWELSASKMLCLFKGLEFFSKKNSEKGQEFLKLGLEFTFLKVVGRINDIVKYT